MVRSEQAITRLFTTESPTTRGVLDADTLPTAVLVVNSAVTEAVVTVVKVSTGLYSASVALPALVDDDSVALVVSATVDGVPSSGVIWEDICDESAENTLRFLRNKQTAPRTGVGTLITYADDDTTPLFSQAISDDGTTITRGSA